MTQLCVSKWLDYLSGLIAQKSKHVLNKIILKNIIKNSHKGEGMISQFTFNQQVQLSGSIDTITGI